MMNENSPICARLMPAWIDVRAPLPVRNAPSADAHDLADDHRQRSARRSRRQWRTSSAGSISMPTETKNTAANTSRTGWTRCSIACASPDSATSEPAMNAPSATE